MSSIPGGMSEPSTAHLEALLARVRAGDALAREEVLRGVYWRAQRLTRFILNGRFDRNLGWETDELLNESYLKFVPKYRDGLKRESDNLREFMGYLSTIIHSTAMDQIRKLLGDKYKTQFSTEELPPDTPEDIRKRFSFQMLKDDLPSEEYEVVELKFEWLCTEAEMAQMLGISRHELRTTYLRAIARLKKDFDDLGRKGPKSNDVEEEF
jgi:RNA polymerase sigma factor (sigma-70 family)